MKNFIKLLPSIVCIIISAWLMDSDKTGWGWFLVVALLLGGAALDSINKYESNDEVYIPDD